jgi:hypothetical protein
VFSFQVFLGCGQGHGEEGIFLFFVCSHEVPSAFSSSSQSDSQVLNLFPKTFPIQLHLYFHIVCPGFNFHVHKL